MRAAASAASARVSSALATSSGRLLGQLIGAGGIELGVGNHFLLAQPVGARQLPVGNFQGAAGLGQVRLGHRQFGVGLRHRLLVLVVIEFGHHLAARDRIGQIDGQPLHPAAHFRRQDRSAPSLPARR